MKRRILTTEDAARLLGQKLKLRYRRFMVALTDEGWVCERGHVSTPPDCYACFTVLAEDADSALERAMSEFQR